ncbi:MAG: hypothetical protein Kow0059_09020 [Candidatus Sumerlaeia bacterium]
MSLSALMFEILLTRIFSVMLWYHFAYVVISIAMLGLGASGSFLALALPRFKDRSAEKLVAWSAVAYPLCLIYCFLLATRIRVNPFELVQDKSNLFALFAIYSLLTVPFFLAGVCIGFLLSRFPSLAGRLYFWDLAGAAVGSVLVMLTINLINAPAGVMAAAAAGAAGAVCFVRMAWGRWLMGRAWLTMMISLFALGVFLHWNWDVLVPRSKELYYYQEHNEVDYQKWTTVARVDVSTLDRRYTPSFGGEVAPAYSQDKYTARFITQDGVAPTLFFAFAGEPAEALPFLPHTTQSGAYLLKDRPRVLTIGIGGGIDLLVALTMGAGRITAVEINPVMVDLCRHRFAAENGGVFNDPRIQWVVQEGRHYLAHSREQFDIIQMSGVDTFAALSSGAYVLSESYLYTLEAIRDVLARLAPDGIFSVSRFYFADKPRETLRLASTMLAALEEGGASNPAHHLFVLRRHLWATILMKKTPWSQTEADRLAQFCRENDFEIIHHPYQTSSNSFSGYLTMPPPARRDFARTYPFHLDPATDDKPFFFQFLKWSSFLKGAGDQDQGWGYFITRAPVAYQTLLTTLAMLTLMSVVLIGGPLLWKRASFSNMAGGGRVLLYFSMLGLGFMFVEIILVQKFIVYAGNPLYSISLILAGLLMFSGVGAALSQNVRRPGRAALGACVLLAVVIAGESAVLPTLTRLTLAQPLAVRMTIILAAILPLGLLMGMPFPLGLRLVAQRDESLAAWAWAINACLTVIGAMLSILLSTLIGFTAVLVLAASLYGIAGFCAASLDCRTA